MPYKLRKMNERDALNLSGGDALNLSGEMY